MIFTFYSYKGGVGRTMALANVAERLFRAGLRVLIVDWDLEAPGLERFFPEGSAKSLESQGVIDMLLDYKRKISQDTKVEKKVGLPFQKPDELAVDLHPNSDNGRLLLITAGRRSEKYFDEYAKSVLSFDWLGFYEKYEGELYIEWLRQQFERLADIVLIDSRTGVTEMGGVCTYQLADVVVMFCAPNLQNMDGTCKMASNFAREDLKQARLDRGLSILIVPARVEDREEMEKLNKFKAEFIERFDKLMPMALKNNEKYNKTERSFWELKVPQVPYYAFNEIIAIDENMNGNKDTSQGHSEDIIRSFDILTATLSELSPFSISIRDSVIAKSRRQDLQGITIQIRNSSNIVVGSGIVVSRRGLIVTHKDVYDEALKNNKVKADRIEIDVCFPGRYGKEDIVYKAEIVEVDNDLVLLQLKSESLHIDDAHVAKLGNGKNSAGNSFRSYGFYPSGIFNPRYASGMILKSGDNDDGSCIKANMLNLDSNNISSKMSGAPILDIERDLVVGICSQNKAMTVDACVLAGEPFYLVVSGEPLSIEAAKKLRIDLVRDILDSRCIKGEHLSPSWNNAPAPVSEDHWSGRNEILDSLTINWKEINSPDTDHKTTRHNIVGLIGFGGEGKSSIARHWIDNLIQNKNLPQPYGVFWWRFQDNPNEDKFLEEALKYLIGNRPNGDSFQEEAVKHLVGDKESDIESTRNERIALIGEFFDAGRFIFILDGLEALQEQSRSESRGEFINENSAISNLLEKFRCSGGRSSEFVSDKIGSLCLITSRVEVLKMKDSACYTKLDVDPLSISEGLELLCRLGVTNEDGKLEQWVSRFEGHALALSLIAKKSKGVSLDHLKILIELPEPHAQARSSEINRFINSIQNSLALEPIRSLYSSYEQNLSKYEQEAILLLNDPKAEVIFRKMDEKDKIQFAEVTMHLKKYYIFRFDEKLKRYVPRDSLREYIKNAGNIQEYFGGIFQHSINNANLFEASTQLMALNGLKSVEDDALLGCFIQQNLAELHWLVGSFEESLSFAKNAYDLAERISSDSGKREQANSLILMARASYLKGDWDNAERYIYTSDDMLKNSNLKGGDEYDIRRADLLLCVGNIEEAKILIDTMAMENMKDDSHFANLSRCHRILGDIYSNQGASAKARENYDQGYEIIEENRNSTLALVEVLAARGRFLVKDKSCLRDAFGDLNEALGKALKKGYNIYEVDIRVSLAWAHIAEGNMTAAREEARKAWQLSRHMGYRHGIEDSEKILKAIESVQQ